MYGNKTVMAVFTLLFIFLLSVAAAEALTPEESLKKNFPDLTYEAFSPSPVKGLYEVTAGMQIYYYAPEAEILIVGQLIAKDGTNQTAARKLKLVAGKIKEIPLEKALKIGNGKNQVIEFSDPDCGYCRKASEFFSKREDVTRYVFFFPLSERSETKVRHILCSADRERAYKNVYEGKMDGTACGVCKDEKVETIIKADKDAGNRLGIEGTPFFFINGKAVPGADLELIEKLLTGQQPLN